MRRNTQCGRLLHALVLTYPRWIGGAADGRRYDFSWHTQSQRSGELRDDHGFPCVSQRRRGEQFSEYRIKDEATFHRARLLVKSWETGVDVKTLEAQESLRPLYQPGLAL